MGLQECFLTAQVLDELDNLRVASESANIFINVDATALVSINEIKDVIKELVHISLHRSQVVGRACLSALLGAQKSLDLETEFILSEGAAVVLIEGMERR